MVVVLKYNHSVWGGDMLRYGLFLAALMLPSCTRAPVLTSVEPTPAEVDAGFDGVFMSYYLPRAELPVKISFDPKKSNRLTLTHPAAPTVVPDTRTALRVAYRHHDLSTDNVTIEVKPNGLLANVSSTTNDETLAVAKAVTSILSEVSSFREAAAKPNLTAEVRTTVAPCAAASKSVVLDLTYKRSQETTLKGGGCEISIRFEIEPDSVLLAGAYAAPEPNPNGVRTCPNDAVCFRTAAAMRVRAKVKLRHGNQTFTDVKNIGPMMAPVADPTGVLYFKRRAFVENSVSATFTDGTLTKITTKDPSTLAAALALPAEILKSLTILVKL